LDALTHVRCNKTGFIETLATRLDSNLRSSAVYIEDEVAVRSVTVFVSGRSAIA
jgi:hypothetical protein